MISFSVWRFTHFTLALIGSLFLLIASVTGTILAFNVPYENVRAKNAYQGPISVYESVKRLKKEYPEIYRISTDRNQNIIIEGVDVEGNDVHGIVNPETGKKVADVPPKDIFIEWVTSLHRSLFLHQTGRFLVGIVSVIFFLMLVSGMFLLVQQKISFRDFFQYRNGVPLERKIHVLGGKIFFIPFFIVTLSAVLLFMIRFSVLEKSDQDNTIIYNTIRNTDFNIFKEVKITDIQILEFPFTNDRDEFFILKLEDKEFVINQFTGNIIEEKKYGVVENIERISLDIHTGRSSNLWAVILGFCSLSILLFVYSGFSMTLKKYLHKIKNRFSADESEIILLVGSQSGSTMQFATRLYQQLVLAGRKVYITTLNEYRKFMMADHFIIFTSTYGAGEAPDNANIVERKISALSQNHKIYVSTVGFGSQNYSQFCAFSRRLHRKFLEQSWAVENLDHFSINEKSVSEFIHWVDIFNSKTGMALSTNIFDYRQEKEKIKVFEVLDKTEATEENNIFKITLKIPFFTQVSSGDLLKIFPLDNKEVIRYYSISRISNTIELLVKLHDGGIGSSFLYCLQRGNILKAVIVRNERFAFPASAREIIMIANGVGIAPFKGMISENKNKVPVTLYAGFRREDNLTKALKNFVEQEKNNGKIREMKCCFSKEQDRRYVSYLVKNDIQKISESLINGSVVMICGSQSMFNDIMDIFEEYCKNNRMKSLSFYREQGQILSDCY